MAVPVSQAWTVATYVLKQKLAGRKKYPLVLMLEPLFRCNLACAGCGKIQYPAHILKAELTPEECFKAAEECGTPMVAIPGGEPLLHPQDAGDRRRFGCAQEVCLHVHQCAAAEGEAASLHAERSTSRSLSMWTASASTTISRCAAKAAMTLRWRACMPRWPRASA